MLAYKVTPPSIPECINRPRLLDAALARSVVVLAAPAGYGKTCLAAQIAAATGGPVAWFTADELDRDRGSAVANLLAALGTAWRDVAAAAPAIPDDDVALALLAATLETIAGPGCVVVDDAHLLPADVLDAVARTAAATLAPDCRLVVCTRHRVPCGLASVEASRRAVTIDATELAFDSHECARIGPPASADALRDRTGGWPLAIALAVRGAPAADPPLRLRDVHLGVLAGLALHDLDPGQHDLLVTLVHLPRFPDRLLARLGEGPTRIGAFARAHPELFGYGAGWWSPREWLREALAPVPPDPALLDAVVQALVDLDETELAARLLTAAARFEEAVPLVERLASEALLRGRAAWSRALIDEIPGSLRPFDLQLLAATTDQLLGRAEAPGGGSVESVLIDLVERAGDEGPGALLRTQAVLADHYRMSGDPRALVVCERALGDALSTPAEALGGRWSAADAPAAAEMLRYYGFDLLLSPDPATMVRGRSLLAAAIQVLESAGRPTVSQQAWWQYFEVLTFRRSPAEALASVRHAAHLLAAADHLSAAIRLAELATVEFFAGEATTGHTIELARELADRTGNRMALAPIAAIDVALAVEASSFSPALAGRFDETMAQLLADPRLERFAPLIAAEFGIVLVRQAEIDAARRYLERAEQTLGTGSFAHAVSLRCARLRALIRIGDGEIDRGRAALLELRGMALAEARPWLVALVDADLAAVAAPRAAEDGRTSVASRVAVIVLAPELSVTLGGAPVPPPRGYPAKLLTMLIACGGVMTIDAAIEGLWPGADPDVGRNRLHGVMLRLRRGLGLPAGGPISCTEGVVRIEATEQVAIDAWSFERVASGPGADAVAAADRYTGDALSAQYAYDDTIAAYRHRLHRLFVRSATAVLDDPPPSCDPEYVAALAYRAWSAAPDDEDLCRAAARALARQRHVAAARQLIEGTAHAWTDLGLDGDAWRARTLQDLGLPA